ncbi:DUF5781 family protein [Haloarchaeobius amylolyticus]|uniref:DUF5781 family protein n=1 Tax=Haloarchaeobius amylolyticus TaxID=1198296 RepID=UPI002272028A|nr:DUF5781 family protein [Haloarchaeobius amylolyticus]
MEVRVQGSGPTAPFLSARDLFETEADVELPIRVHVREDPDERTWTGHYDDHHVLNISRRAATSVMARELTIHEFAHMVRYEEEHPSHVQSTDEALFLGLAGNSVERRKVAHCYQIANHMKDIYADDITMRVSPPEKLVSFLESSLAAAVADQPSPPRAGLMPIQPGADPDITAVNAAFALALVERHDLVDDDHPMYELARVAASDAPDVSVERFKRHFATLADDPSESGYRKALVDVTREYALGRQQAAD